jgi:Raf kinase inhibitor-like YbhB/YbcL family protein
MQTNAQPRSRHVRWLVSIVAVATMVASGCSSGGDSGESAGTAEETVVEESTMAVTSSAYGDGERIPVEFTCDGEGTQPSYTVSGLPSGTVSIAIVMDATVPQGVFTHWVQFDMPPESDIPQDAIDLGTLGSGLFGALGYAPPCPQGDAVGVYTVQVFAADSLLGLNEGASKQMVLDALEGRVIGLGELTGEYSRS